MPTSNAVKQQRKVALQHGLKTLAQVKTTEAVENALATAQADLLEATAQIESLEATISLKNQENLGLIITQKKLLDKLTSLESKASLLGSKNSELSHKLRIARQNCNRQSRRNQWLVTSTAELKRANTIRCSQLKALKSQSRDLKSHLRWLQVENQKLVDMLSKAQNSGEAAQQKYKQELAAIRTKLLGTQQQKSKLKKQTHRAAGVLERSLAQKEKTTFLKATTYHLMEKGVFKEPVRDLVRWLFRVGVPGYRINEVIHRVCDLVGMQISGTISRTSVARFIQEGEVSAKLQIGYELSQTQGIFSKYL
jgi:hypothetical protein